MVYTRSRKRVAGEGDGTTTARTKRSTKATFLSDNEPSELPPKSKRQRTATTAASSTAAVRTRKGRALKPVATNANAKSGVKAKVVKRAVAAKPVAVAVRATRRGRPPKQKQQQQAEEEPPSQRQRQQKQGRGTSTTTKSASSAGATRAGAEQQHENEHEQQDANPPLVSTGKTASAVPLEPSAAAESSARTEHSSYQNGVPDNIDERDADDPLSVTDYVEDMYEHFRSKEEISSVDCMYMGRADEGKQPNINESMRCILVDWLIEVHYKFKLFPETLYLTVNILDRFLSQTLESITKRDLQLVGVTSLLVAAKYEEMYVPELRDLTYICDGAYTEARILRMEERILKTLNYNVTVPTPHTFLIRFLKAAHADKLMAQLACFLLDGTLLSLEKLTCRWRPSQLAAAAILLARRQLGRHNWSPTLVVYSQYREEDVLPVAKALLQNKHRLEENRELMALAKKYSKTKYGKVSHIGFLPLENDIETSSHSSEADSLAHSDL